MFSKTEIKKKYYEDKNFNRLMSVCYDHFNKTYNYKIGSEEEEVCHLVMQSIYTHTNPENNENRIQFIKRLNRLCVNELMRIITNKINEINHTPDLVRDQLLVDEGNNVQSKIANFPKPIPIDQQNSDVNSYFDQVNKERSTEIKELGKHEIPKFELEMDQNNLDIEKAFQETQQKFEEDRKLYEASQKVIQTEDGVEIVIKDQESISNEPLQSEPFASNIDSDQNLLIGDNKIINPTAIKDNKLLINQPKQFEKVIKDIYEDNKLDHYIVIDSRDRNHDLFVNPNNYQVEFDNVLKSIISIELVSAELPAVQYNINTNNNLLYFNQGGATLTATIPIGQYDDIDNLRSAIQSAINSATDSDGDYTVTVSTVTRKMTLTKGSGTFGLEFVGDSEVFVEGQTRTKYLASSIGPVIGFSRSDLTSALTYTGDNQYNLNGENYILLYVKGLENLESVSGNATIHDTFTKINLDSSTNNIKFYNQLDEYISKVIFTPPLASIGQMIIKFYNYDGSSYDFGGREHSLYFKITTYNQPMEYFQG